MEVPHTVQHQRVEMLLGLDRADEAIREINACLGRDPRDARMLQLKARALSDMERHEAAASPARDSVGIAPHWAWGWCWLGVVLGERVSTRREATDAFTRAMQIDPRDPAILGNWGRHLSILGDKAGAEKAYREALAISPDYLLIMLNLSELIFYQRRLDESERLCDAALRLDPGNARAHSIKGLILEARRQPEKAIDELRESLRLCPTSEYVQTEYRRLRRQVGRPVEEEREVLPEKKDEPPFPYKKHAIAAVVLLALAFRIHPGLGAFVLIAGLSLVFLGIALAIGQAVLKELGPAVAGNLGWILLVFICLAALAGMRKDPASYESRYGAPAGWKPEQQAVTFAPKIPEPPVVPKLSREEIDRLLKKNRRVVSPYISIGVDTRFGDALRWRMPASSAFQRDSAGRQFMEELLKMEERRRAMRQRMLLLGLDPDSPAADFPGAGPVTEVDAKQEDRAGSESAAVEPPVPERVRVRSQEPEDASTVEAADPGVPELRR